MEFGYNTRVRTLAAGVIGLMIAVVLTADPFCCADGCTNGQQSAVTAPTCCALCMSSVTVPTAAVLTRVTVVQFIMNDLPTRDVSSPARQIEHPPRFA